MLNMSQPRLSDPSDKSRAERDDMVVAFTLALWGWGARLTVKARSAVNTCCRGVGQERADSLPPGRGFFISDGKSTLLVLAGGTAWLDHLFG